MDIFNLFNMETFNLVVWTTVYSICLVHITLFIYIYIKHKSKIELLYLIVLSNIFLPVVIITLSLVFKIDNFIPLLVNGSLTLYISVPLWGYYLFDIDKKYFKIIPILVLIEAVIDNILIVYDLFGILYISRIIFYILLAAPAFINRKNIYEKDSTERDMQRATKIVAAAFIIFMALLIPLSLLIFEISYVSSLFWAVFSLSYQIPGLVYCKDRLLKKSEAGVPNEVSNEVSIKAGISALTKRENDIALAICNGLKYKDIADKLCISLSTVKTHSYTIYRKLGINNNRELMQIFMESPQNDTEDPSDEPS